VARKHESLPRSTTCPRQVISLLEVRQQVLNTSPDLLTTGANLRTWEDESIRTNIAQLRSERVFDAMQVRPIERGARCFIERGTYRPRLKLSVVHTPQGIGEARCEVREFIVVIWQRITGKTPCYRRAITLVCF
jgi:hypothetical protein